MIKSCKFQKQMLRYPLGNENYVSLKVKSHFPYLNIEQSVIHDVYKAVTHRFDTPFLDMKTCCFIVNHIV